MIQEFSETFEAIGDTLALALAPDGPRSQRVALEIQRRKLLRERTRLLDIKRIAELRSGNLALAKENEAHAREIRALGLDPVDGLALPNLTDQQVPIVNSGGRSLTQDYMIDSSRSLN